MQEKRNVIARVEDPDLLENDDATCEVWLMFFEVEKDKYRRWTDQLQLVWMRKDGTLTGHPVMGGIVVFDRYKNGSASIDQAFKGVTEVRPTKRFVTERYIPDDKRKNPVYTMRRVYRVYYKAEE